VRVAPAAKLSGRWLTVKGAHREQLARSPRVAIPLGVFTCITGVSGSGKSRRWCSTPMYRALSAEAESQPANVRVRTKRSRASSISRQGHSRRSKAQSGARRARIPRPTPACSPHIRELFAQLPEARMRGYGPGRFSSTSRAADAKRAKATASFESRCTFCPTLRPLRGLRRQALQSRHARDSVQGQEHCRRCST